MMEIGENLLLCVYIYKLIFVQIAIRDKFSRHLLMNYTFPVPAFCRYTFYFIFLFYILSRSHLICIICYFGMSHLIYIIFILNNTSLFFLISSIHVNYLLILYTQFILSFQLLPLCAFFQKKFSLSP